ncbi:hypothetical protein CRG98_021857, partial [Punica granatum]
MADSSSSAAPARSDAETEELLDRMLTRLALCDDSKLGALLSKLLPLSISSLSTPSQAVRSKVLEILSHVNKRVKHQSEIGLPLSELWRIYMENDVALIVRNFCILYIEMAFERVDMKEKEMMAPVLVANVSKLPHQHQEIILRIASKVIGECHSNRVDPEVAAKYKALSNSRDRDLFLEFCLHAILYQPPSKGGGSPPGLSIAQANRVVGKDPFTSQSLTTRKLGLLNVIETMELDPEVVYPIYLAASADSQEAVIKRGDELLKKKASGANFDDPLLINRVFVLFHGTPVPENVAPDSRISPANSALRVKLMEKIDMAVRLFDSMKLESQSIRFAIQEATNSLSVAYKGAPAFVLNDLEPLLLKNSQEEQSEVRFCAVRWATSLFNLQHCPSRFICMLGAADSKLDIREMALEGLFPLRDELQTMNSDLHQEYPKLGAMLDYILSQQPKVLESTEVRGQRLIFPSETYIAMIKFLLKCFEAEMEQNGTIQWSSEFKSSVQTMCLLLEHAMAFEGSVELHATASKALLTIGSRVPEVIASHYATKVSWLKQLLNHTDLDTRESAARLLGLASSSLPTPASTALISELISSISGSRKPRFELYHGAVCAIGYVAADCVCKTPAVPETLFQSVLKCLVDVVNTEGATLASIAMQALGHIGLRVPLTPLINDSGPADIFMVIQEKLKKLLSGDDIKAIQKVVVSLGHICVKETSSSHLNMAIELIFSLCRSRVEDVLFAAGEALSFMWGAVPVTADTILKTNYTSLSMSSKFLMENVNSSLLDDGSKGFIEVSDDARPMVREAITRKLFDGLLYSTRKEERCAGTVSLLSLTMYCGHHSTIQQMLPEIQ